VPAVLLFVIASGIGALVADPTRGPLLGRVEEPVPLEEATAACRALTSSLQQRRVASAP